MKPLNERIDDRLRDIQVLSWDLDGRIDWRDGEPLPWGFRGNATIGLAINGQPHTLVLPNYDPVNGPEDVLLDGESIDDDLWDSIYAEFPPLLVAQLTLGKSPDDKNVDGHNLHKYVVEPGDVAHNPIDHPALGTR